MVSIVSGGEQFFIANGNYLNLILPEAKFVIKSYDFSTPPNANTDTQTYKQIVTHTHTHPYKDTHFDITNSIFSAPQPNKIAKYRVGAECGCVWVKIICYAMAELRICDTHTQPYEYIHMYKDMQYFRLNRIESTRRILICFRMP